MTDSKLVGSIESSEPVTSIWFAILVFFYIMQAIVISLNAAKPGKDGVSLWRQLFVGIVQLTDTWTTFLLVLLLPVGISWLAAWVDNSDPGELGLLLYSGTLSGLIVLITLEFSLLNDLRSVGRPPWQGLLFVTLVLDMLSLLLLIWPIGRRISEASQWFGLEIKIGLLFLCALISSSLVLLFAKKAGESR